MASRKALLFLVATVLLVGVAAVASREPLRTAGTGAAAGGAGFQNVTASPWELVLVGAGAVLALVGLAAYLGWVPRRRTPEPFRTQPPFTVPLLGRLALVLLPVLIGGVLVAGGLAGSHRTVIFNGSPHAAGTIRLSGPSARRPVASPSSSFDLPTWVPVAILALVLGGAVVVIAKPSTHGGGDLSTGRALAPAIASGITVSLENLATDPDARRAVIVAYRRMEESLAAAGIPRAAAEAPREYLWRASATLEIDRKPLGTLTTLFERAKFSLRPFDVTLRDQAIAALGALQEELV